MDGLNKRCQLGRQKSRRSFQLGRLSSVWSLPAL